MNEDSGENIPDFGKDPYFYGSGSRMPPLSNGIPGCGSGGGFRTHRPERCVPYPHGHPGIIPLPQGDQGPG